MSATWSGTVRIDDWLELKTKTPELKAGMLIEWQDDNGWGEKITCRGLIEKTQTRASIGAISYKLTARDQFKRARTITNVKDIKIIYEKVNP